jgi:hypothetical protein
VTVTDPYAPEPPLAPTPRPKRNTTLIVAAAIGVIVLVAAAVVITLAATKSGRAAKPAANVPVVENIPQPNPKCTPAADRKLGFGDDLSKIYWFGWMDGKQADMPVGQALAQRIAGHEVRDAWYCPPRADW